ncbi:MAG: DUF983 domain-containing protein [Parafilimonas sp.]|nr:DUF983 domain-containing protein [Parafilimonas sp.]
MSSEKPSYLLSVLANHCPRCRRGDIFQTKNPYALKGNKYMKMHDHCPLCGQPTDLEVGFYYGTGFVSYGLTVALSGVTFVAWWLLIGISVNDNRVFWWLGVNTFLLIVLQPPIMRFSRSLWLSWFVKYNPNWEKEKPQDLERVVKEEMGNW